MATNSRPIRHRSLGIYFFFPGSGDRELLYRDKSTKLQATNKTSLKLTARKINRIKCIILAKSVYIETFIVKAMPACIPRKKKRHGRSERIKKKTDHFKIAFPARRKKKAHTIVCSHKNHRTYPI